MAGVGPPPGSVVWCDLDPVIGHEQGGRRPVVVISSAKLSAATPRMALVVPCTTRDRGWFSHVSLSGETGLTQPTFAITEQPRAISTDRIHRVSGRVDVQTISEITRWVHMWIDAP